jgi:hypothetical protein
MLMDTAVRRLMTLAVLFTTSVVMLLSGATTAAADDPVSSPPESSPPETGSVQTSAQVITVSVWGDGYHGGSPGSPGSGGGGRVSVSVPAPCWMEVFISGKSTGKEYFEYVKSGEWARWNPSPNDASPMTPFQGYEEHKDDDVGHWYSGVCYSGNWPKPNDLSGFLKFTDQFFGAHPGVYVPATQTPPTPPVPPVLLREIAIKNLTLPDPKLDWNPKLKGNQGTLVNLDTWFWLNEAPTTLSVHAAAGGNEASVTAMFGGMDISAPGEATLSCAGPGTPYAASAHATTCALAFSRASAALGAAATPVTVKSRWSATWSANGVDQGLITPQPSPDATTANIPVDEVQTVVTGTG